MLAHCDSIAFIATAHPEQARAFYSEVLGLPLLEHPPFALVFDANGTMLRIQKVETLTQSGYTVLGWHVGDIHEAVGSWGAEASTLSAMLVSHKMSRGFGPLLTGIKSRGSPIRMGISYPSPKSVLTSGGCVLAFSSISWPKVLFLASDFSPHQK
jgi:hypothetical protein